MIIKSTKDQIDYLMEILIFGHLKPMGVKKDIFSRRARIPNVITAIEAGNHDNAYFVDSGPHITWPIDQSVIVDKGKNTTVIQRIVSADANSMRGRVRRVYPKMAWLFHWNFSGEKIEYNEVLPVGLVGGKWVCLDIGMRIQSDAAGGWTRVIDANRAKEIHETCQMLFGVALTKRYAWEVYLSIDDSPAIAIQTDPVGIRNIFKDREKGNGLIRAALRNWITDHWRQSRSDPEAEDYVRKHMRGADWFQWNGFDCRIFPSEFDCEQNEQLREARAAMTRAESRRFRKAAA